MGVPRNRLEWLNSNLHESLSELDFLRKCRTALITALRKVVREPEKAVEIAKAALMDQGINR